MEINELSENFTVTGQISVSDVNTIKSLGFNAVVCNRPDGESEDQVASSEIYRACVETGLNFSYIPMNGPSFTEVDVINLKNVIIENDKVFAYCRSGNRSSILFNATQ
jgi:uncharacterized protein (TIGR01244 family)